MNCIVDSSIRIMKSIWRNLVPPIIQRVVSTARKPTVKEGVLFDVDDASFKEIVGQSKVYAEYGCGASTIWVFQNTTCDVLSVDTSKEWLAKVAASCQDSKRIRLHHSDLGAITEWGRPAGYSRHENFSDYTDWVWIQGASPDVVLIDGRFRVCCFLTSLLKAKKGTWIIFDDYMNRPNYHIVETLARRVKTCGRQGIFRVEDPAVYDRAEIERFIERFRFVMD